jgi:Xaa-Pro aminopeptidase
MAMGNAEDTSARIARLRVELTRLGVDAILISQPENRRYLSGFTGSAGWLLISQERTLFATDFRYYEQVSLESPGFEIVKITKGFDEAFSRLLASGHARRIAFEADYGSYADVEKWKTIGAAYEWVPSEGVVTGLRAVKDAAEVAAMRAAIRLGDEALAAALARVTPTMTERQLAWEIESYFHEQGAEGPSFDTIVASGPNGSRPHARASDAPLGQGVPVVIDMGVKLNGYCSDLTRTVCLGQPLDPDKFYLVYNTVLKAQLDAEKALRAGLTGQAVDAVAREVIGAAGFAEYFGHGLGHSVGLAIHEDPRLSQTYTGVLAAGTFITVEPGIYLPGWGGVRIEDIALITDTGCEIISSAPKEPVIIRA